MRVLQRVAPILVCNPARWLTRLKVWCGWRESNPQCRSTRSLAARVCRFTTSAKYGQRDSNPHPEGPGSEPGAYSVPPCPLGAEGGIRTHRGPVFETGAYAVPPPPHASAAARSGATT